MIKENLTDYIAKAMVALIPRGNQYSLRGNDWSSIEWDASNPNDCPTEAEISAKAEEFRVADIYGKPRKKAYLSVQEQLDLLFHDMTAGKCDKTGEWYKAIAKVKTDNPK
jgi:hypothetical protein